MSELTVFSPKRNRVYVRKFDHDEARRRHAAGESYTDLAREYGVTRQAVRSVVDESARRRLAVTKDLTDHGICVDCGESCLSADHPNRVEKIARCTVCAGRRRRERLRFTKHGDLIEVRCTSMNCANGERWQTPENFARGSRFRDVRPGSIHGMCRACLTRARREYRHARRVPCSHGCGTLVHSENSRHPGKPPECNPCAMKRVHAERRAS